MKPRRLCVLVLGLLFGASVIGCADKPAPLDKEKPLAADRESSTKGTQPAAGGPTEKGTVAESAAGPSTAGDALPLTPDPSVIAAWEEAGAEFGWCGVNEPALLMWRSSGKPLLPNDMASFRFNWGSQRPSVKELPPPGIPFAIVVLGANDAWLEELVELEELQTLGLVGPEVTDAGSKVLANLKQLQVLYLRNTQVTDAGLSNLVGLTQLTHLFLGQAQVTDGGLKHLAEMAQLQRLDLYGTQVTDAGLKYLTQMTQLQSLGLFETQVTDEGLKELAGRELEILHLPKRAWTDLGLRNYLAAIRHPKSLILSSWEVTDAGLKELAQLTELRELFLIGTQVTDAGLKDLANMKQLRSLALGRTQVTDAGLDELAGMTQLKLLFLQQTQVTEAGVRKLQQALPNCKIVH